MNEAERWTQFGQYLAEQRQRLGLKRRDAAKRAKLTESAWRDLETGHENSYGGVRVLPHPSPEVLNAVAEALEVPPEELLRHVPRRPRQTSSPARTTSSPEVDDLSRRIARLSDRDRRVVASLVDSMLADE